MLIKKSNDYVTEITRTVNSRQAKLPRTIVYSILSRYLELLKHYIINDKRALKIDNRIAFNTRFHRINGSIKPEHKKQQNNLKK